MSPCMTMYVTNLDLICLGYSGVNNDVVDYTMCLKIAQFIYAVLIYSRNFSKVKKFFIYIYIFFECCPY